MNVLDFVFIGILLIFSLRGLARGLINEVFGFGSFAVSLLLAAALIRRIKAETDYTKAEQLFTIGLSTTYLISR